MSNGSGISRNHRFSSAASWTGFSSDKFTVVESLSRASEICCNRLIFPFFRKIPSIAISARQRVLVLMKQ